MSQFEIPEVSLSTGSDDLTEDNWFSSPTTSFDGSSVNSIPWAEDVVKQNKEEWDRIERMFYGEEPLPADEKLRTEIIEWVERFPHIRVAGQQSPIFYDPNAVPEPSSFEEVIEVHPSCTPMLFSKSDRMNQRLEQVLEDSLHIDLDYDHRKSKSSCYDGQTHRGHHEKGDIEKCLRITSGTLLTKRGRNNDISHFYHMRNSPRDELSRLPTSRSSENTIQHITLETSRFQTSKENIDEIINNRTILQPLHVTISEPLSLSARLVEMPDIPRHTSWQRTGSKPNQNNNNVLRITTASTIPTKRPLRSSLTLPSINLVPAFYADTPGRSISALLNHNRRTSTHVPCKSATKLRSESK